MHIIELEHMGKYTKVLEEVIGGGVNRRPRGISTLDLGPTTVILYNPRRGMPLGIGRKLNPAIGAVEAAQLIAGRAAPELVLKIAPQFKSYLDDETVPKFHGSYGDRIGYQSLALVNKLRADKQTRQAVITLWDPWLDNLQNKKDYPCTVSLHFAVVDNQLEMTTVMRSNDAWLGFPYDVFQFTQLQMTIAKTLNLDFGTYRHVAMSLHVYERDISNAHALIEKFSDDESGRLTDYHKTFQPEGIGSQLIKFADTARDMQRIIRNERLSNVTLDQDWYYEQLHAKRTELIS